MVAAIAALGLGAAACAEDTTPRWQLDNDRVLAVRSTPAQLASGQVALLDALVAYADGPTQQVAPLGATAAFAPAGLFTAVHFNLDHWEIDGPDAARLDAANRTSVAMAAPSYMLNSLGCDAYVSPVAEAGARAIDASEPRA